MSIWAWLFRRHHHPVNLALSHEGETEELRSAQAASERVERRVQALEYETSLQRRKLDDDSYRQSH